MPLITHYLPELEETESIFIQNLIGGMSHDQAQLFATAYRGKRKDPHTVLLAAIVGLVAFPGLQRFWLGQIGMGFLYLFTWGLVLVGSIADLVRYKKLAFDYNRGVAQGIASNLPLLEGKPPASIGEAAFSHEPRICTTEACLSYPILECFSASLGAQLSLKQTKVRIQDLINACYQMWMIDRCVIHALVGSIVRRSLFPFASRTAIC